MDLQKIKQTLNNRATEVFDKLGMEYEVFGDNIYSTCPVHESSDNPRAFSFSIEKGIWKCWTRDCQHQYRNDIFGLIRGTLSNREGEDVGFSQALKWACGLLDVKRTTTPAPAQDYSDEFTKLVDIISEEEIVKKSADPIEIGKLSYPSKYFIGRGFKEDTLNHFGVGDCTTSTSKMYDRAVIPIHDEEGKNIVGMIGRTIKEYKSPKFLIYPKGFNKCDFFYNYHRAIEHVNKTGTLFLVEGQGDVWRLYEAGIHNAMSLFGKTLSREQENKLHKMPLTHIIVLTDNDQAGRESKTQLQRQLNRMYKLTFPKLVAKDVGDMSIDQIKEKILPQIKGFNS
ncbi:MAG: toprim domain-containing protein [Alphaproteobacteria bacterium]|nr:toprim domain-containing protein [Alphaproteobacteria bacterium]